VHQAQQGLHGAGNVAAALVAGTATLGHADLGPELGLVHAQLTTDFTHINFFGGLHFAVLKGFLVW
jgi:hypothetical protein